MSESGDDADGVDANFEKMFKSLTKSSKNANSAVVEKAARVYQQRVEEALQKVHLLGAQAKEARDCVDAARVCNDPELEVYWEGRAKFFEAKAKLAQNVADGTQSVLELLEQNK